MATSATGGGGGQSAYNSQVLTLVGENSTSGVEPQVEVTYTSASEGGSTTVTTNTTITGAQTEQLKIKSDRVGISTVRCVMSHPTAVLNHADANGNTVLASGVFDGGLSTKTVDFESISAVNNTRSILNYEVVSDLDSSKYTSSNSYGDQNLFLNSFDGQANSNLVDSAAQTIIVYPPEENITVKITLAAAAGQSFNGNTGGEGGVTIFSYTLQKDTEYAFKLGYTISPPTSLGYGGAGAYFYEKGRLLVACGGGGASGWFGGNGGSGGGAGVVGGSGSGQSSGSGGQSINAGQLTSTGIFASGLNGGKVESCTTGDYYASQGITPCGDVGTSQFRDYLGNINSNTASITRGYKSAPGPGYGFRYNGGNSLSIVNGTYVGGGGAGAFGGNATASVSGGGGGASGYTNGSVNVISTSQGGNTSRASALTIELL
tara:strand:+ start:11519 stop:12814 length:1296 start_codon:yes stop_codon:yes gene_type:complete